MTSILSRLGGFGLGSVTLATALAFAGTEATASQAGGTAAQTYKGLEISVSAVARGRNVSLRDCPPGENIVRGVIRPGEENEFVTVTIDVTVSASFQAVPIEKPLLHGADGQEFKTAQSFTDAGSPASYSCEFAFRVPTGTKVASFAIGDASFDIAALDK